MSRNLNKRLYKQERDFSQNILNELVIPDHIFELKTIYTYTIKIGVHHCFSGILSSITMLDGLFLRPAEDV